MSNPWGRPRGLTVEERFWEKVDRRAPAECWPWRKSFNSDGYGRFALTSTRDALKLVLPHRYSWELHFGPIPPRLMVLHACDMPACVNPDHLMLGTNRANMRDASAKGRLRKSAA